MSEDTKINKVQQKTVNKYVKNNHNRINVTQPKSRITTPKPNTITIKERVYNDLSGNRQKYD